MTRRWAFVLLLATACGHTQATGRLFTIAEAGQDGSLKSYPSNASVVDADTISAIRITPSESALRSFAGAHRKSDPALVERLRQLIALQGKLIKSIEGLRQAAEAARAIRASGTKATSEQRTAFLGKHEAFADQFNAIKAYALATEQSAAFEARFNQEENGGSPEFLRSWVADQATAAEQQLAAAAETSGRTLELAAWLGNPAAQVHIPGYDSLTPGVAHVVDNMRFSTVPPEEMEAAKALQQAAFKGGDLQSAAKLAGEEARKALAATLQNLKEQLDNLFTKSEQAPPAAFAALQAKAKTAKQKCTNVVKGVEAMVATIASADPNEDPAAAINRLLAPLNSMGTTVQNCATALGSVREEAEKLAQGAADVATAATSLRGLVDAALSPVAQLAAWATDSQAATAPTLTTFAVPLGSAAPSEISLLLTERKEDDVLTIRARVLEPVAGGAQGSGDARRVVPGGEATRVVRIRAQLFIADTGALVLWTRGVRHDPGPFLPAAGAYAVVRFMGWREDGESGSPAFHLLAPGLGIAAVAIPQASDGSNKLAWMAVGQLFGDVLQVGVGVTADGSPTWGFGIGLHRLAGVGKFFE